MSDPDRPDARPGLRRPAGRLRALAASALCVPALAAAQPPPTCRARSAPVAPQVVELYTSEGCNSCPPADRWLGTLKGRRDVVALAFHVDYWDRLGWTDRFASPAWTQRQNAANRTSGARFSYTPQVLVNGRDHRQWPALPAPGGTAPVELEMVREGDGYVVTLGARDAARVPALAGYWAVTEDGHRTQVRAGENAGVLLQHEAVVRELQPVESLGSAPLRFTPRTAPDGSPGVRRKLHFVVIDASKGTPVQAVSLGC